MRINLFCSWKSCCVPLANISFDSLKLVILMSVHRHCGTLPKLKADDLQGLLNKNPSQKTREELTEQLRIDRAILR